jgi:hypothetical protein
MTTVRYICVYRKGQGYPVAAFLNPKDADQFPQFVGDVVLARNFKWPSAVADNTGTMAYNLLCGIVDSDFETVHLAMRQAEIYVTHCREQIDFQI